MPKKNYCSFHKQHDCHFCAAEDIATKVERKSMPFILKRFETSTFKITVEDLQNVRERNPFIATFWDKTDCLEQDRKVVEFETSGGATSEAFDWLANEWKKLSNRRAELDSYNVG